MLRLLALLRPALLILAATSFILLREPLSAQSPPSLFYYYQGARIPLTLNSNLIAVRFKSAASDAERRARVAAEGDVENFDAREELSPFALTLLPLRAGRPPLAAAQKLKSSTSVLFAAPVFQFSNGAQYIETDEFIVRFKPLIPSLAIAAVNLANGVTIDRAQEYSNRVLILKLLPGNLRSALELANAYAESGWVEFAEPNFVIREPHPRENPSAALATESTLKPNDSSFNLQWSLKNTRQFLGALRGADIKATSAWGVTQGASSLRIAIIDEGVDAGHPDLSGQLVAGHNAIDGSSNTQPSGNDHHGTATAGIAAAHSNNALGIAGVCWACRIVPVKVATEDAQGNWQTSTTILSAGIEWAWNQGAADVLNNSWTMSAPSDDVTNAIVDARFGGRGGKGSTLVFAGGNQNVNAVSYPASLNSYVIAVGASNWCDQRKTPTNDNCNNTDTSWGSNYGGALDLLAPGENIYTTCNGGKCTNGSYTYFSGTSAGTPLVAGAAALLYSLNPNLTPSQIQTALQDGAKDIPPAGRDDSSGWGRLDAYQAIAAMYDLAISVSDGKTLARPNDTLTYSLQYSNTGMTATGSTDIVVTMLGGVNYVSSNPVFTPQGGGVYKLTLSNVASNQTGSASLTAQVQSGSAGQLLTLNAQISSAFPEINTANNSATDTTGVIATDIFLPFILH